MYQKLKRGRKGFTLAELLIVIAIIAILAAIAIPLYMNQMNSAKNRVNQSNARAAASIASAQYMLNGDTGTRHFILNYDGINVDLPLAARAGATGTGAAATGTQIIVTLVDGKMSTVSIGPDASATKALVSFTSSNLTTDLPVPTT